MRKLYILLIAVILTGSAFAQAPDKMSYQAVVRDASNALVTSQGVGMQLSILQGSIFGASVYVETQTPSTNINGLLSLEIGTGTVLFGSFNTIDWSNGPYFIKTETDPTGGTSYTITGTNQLMSVPYALHAKTAESVTGTLNESDPVFVSSIANGITGADTTNWNNHIADTDTQLDSTDIAVLGYVAGAHTIDTDTQLDSIDIANLGYEAGAHTVDTDTQLDSTGVATLGYVAGPHAVDTDTQLDSTDISALGYVAEKTYTIGLWLELGGYVFRVSSDGKHGLVAETQDQGTSGAWYLAQDSISNPATHSVNGQKFMDWRMPTKFELNEIYLQKLAIGGFTATVYWSSTESDSFNAWRQLISNGGQNSINKTNFSGVRAVRAF